jgi:glucose/arabinose dehydrogenase
VYTLGHCNPQGLAWHPITKTPFSTEHGPPKPEGPSGGDELNLIQPGKNYGWPFTGFMKTRKGLEAPLLVARVPTEPASASFYADTRLPEFTNNFFFGSLVGKNLRRLVLPPPEYNSVGWHEALLQDVFGRIREVAAGPDGALYFTTSNRDGHGQPQKDDDRVLRIVPAK